MQVFKATAQIKHKNSIAFGKAPRREADSQPISQSVRQAVSQAVSQARRQADREAEPHSLAFFSGELQLQIVGSHNPTGTSPKALHTCTSWYAHAAKFGSSTFDVNQHSTILLAFCTLCPMSPIVTMFGPRGERELHTMKSQKCKNTIIIFFILSIGFLLCPTHSGT